MFDGRTAGKSMPRHMCPPTFSSIHYNKHSFHNNDPIETRNDAQNTLNPTAFTTDVTRQLDEKKVADSSISCDDASKAAARAPVGADAFVAGMATVTGARDCGG